MSNDDLVTGTQDDELDTGKELDSALLDDDMLPEEDLLADDTLEDDDLLTEEEENEDDIIEDSYDDVSEF